MKRTCKLLVDVGMFVLFLYLMSYRAGRGLLLHGVLGTVLLLLFLIHHLLNLRWYAGVGRGRYPPIRVLFLILDFLLLAAMVGMAVSSVLLSGEVFSFSPFFGTHTARSLHTLSTAWGFVLMLLHLGLHTHAPLDRLRKKAGATVFGYAYYLFFCLILAAGLFCFIQSGLWRNLFLLSGGTPSYTQLAFYGTYGMITLAACQLIHLLMRLLQVWQKRQTVKRS